MRVTVLVGLLIVAACGGGESVSRVIGARCDLSSECDDRCLTGGDYPGGFCSETCDSTAACPDTAVCVSDQGGVCLFTCIADVDCAFLGVGWTCKEGDAHPSGKVMVCRGG